MCWTWVWAVRGLMKSASAMPGFERPAAIRRRTSTSRARQPVPLRQRGRRDRSALCPAASGAACRASATASARVSARPAAQAAAKASSPNPRRVAAIASWARRAWRGGGAPIASRRASAAPQRRAARAYCRVAAAIDGETPQAAGDALLVPLLVAEDETLGVERGGARVVALPAGGLRQIGQHEADAVGIAGRAEDVERLLEPDRRPLDVAALVVDVAEVVQREAGPRRDAVRPKVPQGFGEMGFRLVEAPLVLGRSSRARAASCPRR